MNVFSTITKTPASLQKLAILGKADAFANVNNPDTSFRSANCACGGNCPACQKKSNEIKISQPADAAEIEADNIADRVMRMPIRDQRPVANSKNSSTSIKRKCSACAEEEEIIQRKSVSSGNGVPSQSPTHVSNALSSGGRPLDKTTRNFFESRMGRNFGNVRVHTNSSANYSAQGIDAKAYTLGSNIVFGGGQYNPGSDSGRHLIAHELAHVIQSEIQSSKIHRNTIYRQPTGNAEHDLNYIQTQIAMLQQQLMTPINPMRPVLLERLYKLQLREKILLGKTTSVVRSQESLNNEAVILATKQARRREFWNSLEGVGDSWILIMLKKKSFQDTIKELDLYWDEKEQGLMRKPIISAIERDVMLNVEANRIYGSTLWDLLENKPVKKSGFKKVMDFICENTNPCHDNMEQYHADIDSGMDIDDARARGLFRIGATFIPSRGARPIAKGPGPTPGIGSVKPTPVWPGKLVPATPNGVPATSGVIRQSVPPTPGPFTIPIPTPKPAPAATPKPTAKPAPAPAPKTPPAVAQAPKPTPVPATKPAPRTDADPAPIPLPSPQQPRKKEKKCKDICDVSLPINWPKVMPLPGSQRQIVRTPSNDEYISPDKRSKPQRDLQQEIREQLERHRSGKPGAYVPRPCFANDADPNDLYDAHHIHPLFLGGAEDEINLCALRRDKHEKAHPKLNDQKLMFSTNATWINCKVCSPHLPDHLGQQQYEID